VTVWGTIASITPDNGPADSAVSIEIRGGSFGGCAFRADIPNVGFITGQFTVMHDTTWATMWLPASPVPDGALVNISVYSTGPGDTMGTAEFTYTNPPTGVPLKFWDGAAYTELHGPVGQPGPPGPPGPAGVAGVWPADSIITDLDVMPIGINQPPANKRKKLYVVHYVGTTDGGAGLYVNLPGQGIVFEHAWNVIAWPSGSSTDYDLGCTVAPGYSNINTLCLKWWRVWGSELPNNIASVDLWLIGA
jgi:hypothetical protein